MRPNKASLRIWILGILVIFVIGYVVIDTYEDMKGYTYEELNQSIRIQTHNPDDLDTTGWIVDEEHIIEAALNGLRRSDVDSVSIAPRTDPRVGNGTRIQGEYWVVWIRKPWRNREQSIIFKIFTSDGILVDDYVIVNAEE